MIFSRKHKYFLSVVCIFKNESSGITEWIEHYLAEGVAHFYMIDNGSTDDTASRLQTYLDKGLITLISDVKKWAQVELYNRHFLSKRHESEWLLVCDLDEFIYARSGFKTISDYLKSRPQDTGMIRIPWKMFGSSGLISQPESILASFTKRSIYEGKQNPGMISSERGIGKVIVKGKLLKQFSIHHCKLRKKCRSEDANGQVIDMSDHQPINESLLSKAYLHLNHYVIQSHEWFFSVKSTRGAADWEVHEYVRNLEYFETFDRESNDIEDTELAVKGNQNTRNIDRI